MTDVQFMRKALALARRGYGSTSPNPMVGAVVVKRGTIVGRGWHRRAGGPHAEIEALQDARRRGISPRGATLYVTLEPCSTHGRTPPCTAAIVAAGIRRVVAGATDPNPRHSGKGFSLLKHAGIDVTAGVLADACTALNEAFNHWIVQATPFVTVKAAMTLDGKIATATGESKWITGPEARAAGMQLRLGADAILVGINTVLADDPSLTIRRDVGARGAAKEFARRRIILDSSARTPLNARVVTDAHAALTTVVVSHKAPKRRVTALAKCVQVLVVPPGRYGRTRPGSGVSVRWLLKHLGAENVLHLLVEGGGEANASFLLGGFAHRVAFFYAPKIIGGREARKAVSGEGARDLAGVISLHDIKWARLGRDLMLRARVAERAGTGSLSCAIE